MSTSRHKSIRELLDGQITDYQAMFRLGVAQGQFIASENLTSLDASFDQMQQLMDRIGMRQRELSTTALSEAALSDPAIAEDTARIRSFIVDLMELRSSNEARVRTTMERTRGELRMFGRARSAVKGYQSQQVAEARFAEARFYDGRD